MPDDPFVGSRLKIERANSHIDELNGRLRQLGKLYEFVGHSDPDSGKQLVQLRFSKIPPDLLVIVGEITYLLRSSLDVACVALARDHRGLKVGVSGVAFPFGRSKDDFFDLASDTRKKMKKLSPAAQSAIVGLAPYPGGNSLLMGLTNICNEDKHVQLLPVATANQIRNLLSLGTPRAASPEAGFIAGLAVSHIGQRFEDNAVFDMTRYGINAEYFAAQMNQHFQLAVTICFAKAKAFQGEPVVTTLVQLRDLCAKIIELLRRTLRAAHL